MSNIRRLQKEWREISKHNIASATMYALLKEQPIPAGVNLGDDFADTEIILFPQDQSSLLDWIAFINGPPDTPFEGARFQLKIQVRMKGDGSFVNKIEKLL